MSFTSVLSSIGSRLETFFTGAVKVAAVEEPFVAAVFPGVATLFTSVVSEIGKAEALAIAAGEKANTGPQKLAVVTQAVIGAFNSYATENRLPVADQAQIEAAVNAGVAFLNALPASAAA